MKIYYLFISLWLFLTACMQQPANPKSEYLVITAKSVQADNAWADVVNTLVNRHQAELLAYDKHIDEVMPQIKKLNPRYVAVVEKPENLNRDYVMHLNQISRQVDDDIYADFLWGIITGYDADAAMKMVNNAVEPLVVKDAVSTIMELHSAKWFDRYAWLDDHHEGLWGEKKAPDAPVVTYQLPLTKRDVPVHGKKGQVVYREAAQPEDEMQKFFDIYAEINPDLVVTAAHATERNLEMPFSLGNIKPKDGVLYMDFKDNPQNLKESGKRKIYLPIGNCLIANINNTKESMAVAWMNSANAATMIGYVVTTWYGRNGWGGLKYWLTTPGRYTAAEAFYLNQQDMMYQLNEMDPKMTTLEYPFDKDKHFNDIPKIIEDSTAIEQANIDHMGFLHDRDVLAFYGDPKWDVRLQQIEAENDFTVSQVVKGKKCIVTITTKENFSLERMKGDHFKEEHVLDLPFSYFFPQRLNNPRLADGQNWKAALDENFLLIYNADFEPSKTYTVELNID